MSSVAGSTEATVGRGSLKTASSLVTSLGGRYSTELGIDVDAGTTEVERWFLAAALFGARISASVAERTFHVFDSAGFVRIAQAHRIPYDDLVEMLDSGGYARYDFRTATRLQDLASVVDERYGGEVGEIGRRFEVYPTLRTALDALPGWGPVTVQLFLRELRGVWRGATPPLDARAARAARDLHLLGTEDLDAARRQIELLARRAHIDPRDLESALVRHSLKHRG